ncbi:hypothetical protein BDQ12DRAFT_676474 [Crucibulum laeve]|uniref:SET domain-containing protein n=1 Tax=Crucibulum laeve TaxID=68775 RepID=A0A5C3MN56_9AGAR|nr:hypothetical protein BDQ12DRAFT_676474 [Crucibulum laeve]
MPHIFIDAGYGLFASVGIPRSTQIFTVPASALLNVLTLAPHYPTTRPRLSSVQLISLHLALYRPTQQADSLDPIFGPYISVLPREFDFHPLAWICKRRNGSANSGSKARLLKLLPTEIAMELEKIASRFYGDRTLIFDYLRDNYDLLRKTRWKGLAPQLPEHETTDLEDAYLWGWLNVNTRCIYHRIRKSKSDHDNMTLCPILDFANHTTQLPFMLPPSSDAEIWDTPMRSKPGENFTLISPASTATTSGEELYLKYGSHANKTLFVEYGFVDTFSRMSLLDGSSPGEVDVQYVTEGHFKKRGKLGEWMEDRLREEGYWGDWTIHSSPAPAYPSYRLITALRLYSLWPPSVTDISADAEQHLDSWRDTTLGKRDTISPENESSWRAMLSKICRSIISNARFMISRLDSEPCLTSDDGSGKAMKKNIELLWQEQLYVAMGVENSLREGVQF